LISRNVDKKFTSIDRSFDHYYKKIPDFKLNFKEDLTIKQLESLMDEFLKKISPGLIAMDFRVIWMFEDIEKEYLQVIKELQEDKPGFIFERYCFDEKVFGYIKERLSGNLIADLIPALYNYAHNLKKLKFYTKNISADQQQVFLYELVTACSSRFEKKEYKPDFEGLNEIQIKLLNSVRESWNELFDLFEIALIQLKGAYRNVLLTLFGGLFSRATHDYISIGLHLSGLSFNPARIKLEYDKEFGNETIEDFNFVVKHINNTKFSGDVVKAIEYSDTLSAMVEADLGLKGRQVSTLGSAIYVASIYKYSHTATLLWEIRQSDPEQFILMYEQLYKTMNVAINDDHVYKLQAPLQIELLTEYIHTLVTKNETARMTILYDYAVRTIQRYDRGELFQGEEISNSDFFCTLLVLIARYTTEIDHSFVRICNYSDLEDNLEDNTLEYYKQRVGTDKFYKFYQGSFAKKLGAGIVKSIANSSVSKIVKRLN
jgi:hypothetical protein